MRYEPEAGVVKQSVLGCEEMFEFTYMVNEFSESKTGFTIYRHQVSEVPGGFGLLLPPKVTLMFCFFYKRKVYFYICCGFEGC